MRKIENKMIQAIRSQTNWKSGNTKVEVSRTQCDVRLHGHLIASVFNRGIATKDSPHCVVFDHCGYSTATTRSRLNAIATLCSEYIGFNIIQYAMHYRKGSPESKPQPMNYPVKAKL